MGLSIGFFPYVVSAGIIVNEVAWMGTEKSTAHEWIELHNTEPKEVVVDGWVLYDGAALRIPLSGSIRPYTYALLERSDDTTVPEIPAFLIYAGALSNEGRTLTILRADGTIEDSVPAGALWKNIGGNSVTKETPQWTRDGWVTGVPTPGRENRTVDPPQKVSPYTRRETQSAAVAYAIPSSSPPVAAETESAVLNTGVAGAGVVQTIPIGTAHTPQSPVSSLGLREKAPYLGLVLLIGIGVMILALRQSVRTHELD